MSERESRYSQPKLELFGLYRALRHWRLYIIGVKILQVEVDAKFIQGLLNNPDLQPDAAVNRWIQGILMFHFALTHVPATRFQAPDALSRRSVNKGEEVEDDDDSWLDEIALFAQIEVEKNEKAWIEEIAFFSQITRTSQLPYAAEDLPSCHLSRRTQESDLRRIDHFLRTLESPAFPSPQKHRRFISQATRFMIQDNRLVRRNLRGPPLIVILEPKARLTILTQAHEELGHKGIAAMWEMLKIRFFWPRLYNDIQHHVASCHTCQTRNTKKLEIPITVSTPVALFQKVYIDIMRMPKSGKLAMIVAARDDLSGVCEAKALESANANSMAKFFWTQIYCRYGCPRRVITDNGAEVKAAFEVLMTTLNIPHVKISSYNKHASGVVERGHYTMREALVTSCGGQMSKWPDKLPLAVFADRITVSRITGFSPYQLLHGADPILPFDLAEATFLVEGFRSGMTTAELLTLRIRQLSKHDRDIKKAAETLKQARFYSKAQFEKKFKRKLQKEEYKKGELVLIRNVAIETEVSSTHKTDDRYLGPYEVVRKNKGGAYILKELDGTLFSKNPTAAFRLMPYITRSHWFMQTGWMAEEDEECSSDESSTSPDSSE